MHINIPTGQYAEATISMKGWQHSFNNKCSTDQMKKHNYLKVCNTHFLLIQCKYLFVNMLDKAETLSKKLQKILQYFVYLVEHNVSHTEIKIRM